jgi:hypothetical protein
MTSDQSISLDPEAAKALIGVVQSAGGEIAHTAAESIVIDSFQATATAAAHAYLPCLHAAAAAGVEVLSPLLKSLKESGLYAESIGAFLANEMVRVGSQEAEFAEVLEAYLKLIDPAPVDPPTGAAGS